jgi:PKD repeat protein
MIFVVALLTVLLGAVPGPAHAGLAGANGTPLRPSTNAAPAAAAPDWFNVTAGQRVSPPPLVGASLTYDPADSELVLFGGCTVTACPAPAQTWVYFGGSWTNITDVSSQPPPRSYAGFTFDSHDGYAVLFGGRTASGLLNDTWSFLGGTWTNLTNLSTPTPSARWATQFAFDKPDNYAVLFGGCAAACPLNDTWHFSGGGWRNVTSTLPVAPAPRYAAAFTFDAGDNYLLLQNGCGSVCPLNDTWQFSHGHWTPIPLNVSLGPPPRSFATLTYDAVQNATFLFGGNSSTGPRSDTWRWSAGHWANVTALLGAGPTARFGVAAVPTTVAYVGSTPHKWTFDLLFGGTGGPTPFSATGASAQTWVAEPPPTLAASVLPSTVEVGQVATFTGSGVGGSPPYVYLWQFGDGTSSLLQDPTHLFGAPGVYAPNVTLSDTAGVEVRTATTITVVLGPAVAVQIAPATTDVGVAATFTANVSGGTAPYLYHWSFGDGSTATTSAASHAYSAAGTFLVNLTVTDTVFGTGVRFANVTVHADPSLTTTLSTDTPVAGTPMQFTVGVALGTGPFTYLWAFGDGSSSTSPAPSHVYARPGIYNASITVTDSVGAAERDNVSVQVLPVPPSSGGAARWLGLTSVQWGFVVLGIGGLVALLAAVFLVVRHRRRPPGTPIAAAAVGQPGWGDEGSGEPTSPSSSRSFRRSYRR